LRVADRFLSLSADEQSEALQVAASKSGRPIHLLEKDVWVVWALSTLFQSSLAQHLVFKGGTSLSKAYQAIERFSEDVDLSYDIRALAPDLVGDADDALPASRAEERRWTNEIRKRLPLWVKDEALPIVAGALTSDKVSAKARAEGDKIFIAYDAAAPGSAYVSPEVMLEFGARSTGEPNALRDVVCDAAAWIAELDFPTARPRVMAAERTFWEKATAIHVFCLQKRLRGDRFARHWHDLARLDDAGIAARALGDEQVARAVARHKKMFFAENTADGDKINYGAAVSGGLKLVPDGAALTALEKDYDAMIADGLLLETAEPFAALMQRCKEIETRANARGGRSDAS
jgi:hypothetical protein